MRQAQWMWMALWCLALSSCAGGIPVGALEPASRFNGVLGHEVEQRFELIKDVMTLSSDSYSRENFAQDDILMFGADDSGWVWHTYVEADLSEIPRGSRVIEAHLVLTPVEVYEGAEQTSEFGVHQVMEPWVEEELDWYNQPLTTETPQALCTLERTHLEQDQIDVTAVVQAWANGAANNGLMLRAFDEATDLRKGYHSTTPDFDGPEPDPPHLIILYQPARRR